MYAYQKLLPFVKSPSRKGKDYIGDTDEMCDKREKWIEDIDLFEKISGYEYYYMKEKTPLRTILCGKNKIY